MALAPAVIIIRGSTFHPLAAILSINGLYLLFFLLRVFMVWFRVNSNAFIFFSTTWKLLFVTNFSIR